jgi:hypothetical protein
MSNITDFIQAAVAQQPTKAQSSFNNEVESRIADKLETMRSDIINKIFNSQDKE